MFESEAQSAGSFGNPTRLFRKWLCRAGSAFMPPSRPFETRLEATGAEAVEVNRRLFRIGHFDGVRVRVYSDGIERVVDLLPLDLVHALSRIRARQLFTGQFETGVSIGRAGFVDSTNSAPRAASQPRPTRLRMAGACWQPCRRQAAGTAERERHLRVGREWVPSVALQGARSWFETRCLHFKCV